MLNHQTTSTTTTTTNNNNNNNNQPHDDQDEEHIREIHALSPPQTPRTANRDRRRGEALGTHSRPSSSLSVASTEGASSENFTSMSREFSALVLAGSSIDPNFDVHDNEGGNNLGRIGEEDLMEETNPLAIVPDNNPLNPVPSPRRGGAAAASSSSAAAGASGGGSGQGEVSVQRVKKEEVEAKISAWQNAKVAKINNRFKREDAVINGWESEQVQKATSWMKKVERKLEEKKARALEKMQNEVAKAHRKAEERKASAEAKRGTKVARVLEIANLMRAVGRPPAKRSFF